MNTIKETFRIAMWNFQMVSFRNYAFKSNLKIKWKRPEHIACYKKEKSGDIDSMPEINKSRYQLEYLDCKQLKDADPIVQKLFSLEFAPRNKLIKSYVKDMVDNIKSHPLDKTSIEAKLARWTATIRSLQDIMEKHPRNKAVKVLLKEKIDKRKKYLKFLRSWDYKKFEWLIDNLNIIYKPHPPQYHWITRKDSLRKLTQKYCDEKIDEKLNAYRFQLEAEQQIFLEEKIKTLQFLRKEQIDCGVEVTITQEEIDEAKEQLRIYKEKSDVIKKEMSN